MHWDKCQGCERWRWDYQWRANGCSSNLCASFSLTHCLPLEAPLTSLRDCGLFTDHWLNASFSFPPAFPWSYEKDWGHCQAAFELFINRTNWKKQQQQQTPTTYKTKNPHTTTKTWVPSALLFIFSPPESKTCLSALCCFPQRVKNSPDHGKSCFTFSNSF